MPAPQSCTSPVFARGAPLVYAACSQRFETTRMNSCTAAAYRQWRQVCSGESSPLGVLHCSIHGSMFIGFAEW